MEFLVNPAVRDQIESIKKTLRQFELSELEQFLSNIEENPEYGSMDEKTSLRQRILENDYFVCNVIYEFIKKKKQLIFISLELTKKDFNPS